MDLTKRLFLYRVNSLEDQELALLKSQKMIEKDSDFDMLIIDSFTEHFRAEKDDKSNRPPSMQKQLGLITAISSQYNTLHNICRTHI